MESNVVSSSSTAFPTRDRQKLNCERWSDDLCSNITYTKPWYRAEIYKLQAEISKLEENLKEDKQTFSTVHLDNILFKLLDKLSKDKQDLLDGLDVKGKLNEDGEIDVKRLERFTGLCIHDISLKIEEEKGDTCVRKHHIRGSCRGIKFETTFLVEENSNQDDRHGALQDVEFWWKPNAMETMDDELPMDARIELSVEDNQVGCGKLPQIITLDVSIENEDALLNLKDFLEYVQEEKQLQQFFVTLQNYSKWKRDRLKTFDHFQNEYRELVTYTPLRDETMMTICNQQYPGVRVNIVWKVLVTREGDVKPSFNLQPCIPTEQLESKGFLRSMRLKFLNMLKSVGIEKSIEVIILSIAK